MRYEADSNAPSDLTHPSGHRFVSSRASYTIVGYIIGHGENLIMGHIVREKTKLLQNQASAVALIAFGGWIAWGGWQEAHHGHEHSHESTGNERTALLLILGSSPMIEGLPAFFAATPYGFSVIVTMAILFALSTIGTYIVVSVTALAGFKNVTGSHIERYGEFLSGAVVVAAGIIALFW
jgi:putative Mn2+ efflux pump MntP